MLIKTIASTALLGLFLTGCTINQNPSISEDFGAAVRHNIAVQTLNPDAGGPDDSTTLDGQKAAQTVELYHEPPEQISVESLLQGLNN